MRTPVSLVRCDEYDPERVQYAIRRSIDLLGRIGSFIRSGERVLIKPNLLKGRPPADAATTHPEIVRAVIRLVHQACARAFAGDSPGIGGFFRAVAERSGGLAVIEQEGAVLAVFDEAVSIKGSSRFQRFASSQENIQVLGEDPSGIVVRNRRSREAAGSFTSITEGVFGASAARNSAPRAQ